MIGFMSIRELAEAFREQRLSPVDVTLDLLDRIERHDPQLHAYAHVSAEPALAAAHQAQRELADGRSRGPLHGVPVAVKDLFKTTDAPTALGTAILRDDVPAGDATVVMRLRKAGAVILGKLRMSEAAIADHHPAFPIPLNPWEADAWVGASSSGSGAATAAGLCTASLATDTGGSIRFPAAANGLTGIKPTWGRVSRHNVYEFAGSLDHVGVFARDAWDCAAMLEVVAGRDESDPTSLSDPVPRYTEFARSSVKGLRVGIDLNFCSAFDDAVIAGYRETIAVFRELGADVREIVIPDVSAVVEDWWPNTAVEAAFALGDIFTDERRSEFGQEVAQSLDLGRSMSALDYQAILVRRKAFTGNLQRLFHDIDVLLVPPFGLASPTNERMADFPMRSESWRRMVMPLTCPFDASGNPTVSFPTGFTDRGTPLGMQLIGGYLSEAELLAAVDAFQEATDFHTRHPPEFSTGDAAS